MNKCCICGELGDLRHYVKTFGVVKLDGPVTTCATCRRTYPDSVQVVIPAVGVIRRGSNTPGVDAQLGLAMLDAVRAISRTDNDKA